MSTKRVKTRLFIWHVLVPMWLAAMLYYLFCPDVLFVEFLDSRLHICRHIILESSMPYRIVRNYLFDTIWAYADTVFLYLILADQKRALSICMLLSCAMCVLSEVLQLIGLAKGTFDIGDIIVELIAVFIAVNAIQVNIRRKRNEKKENSICACG